MDTRNSSVGRHAARRLVGLVTAVAVGLLLSCSSPKADKAAGSDTRESAVPEPTPNANNEAPNTQAGEAPVQPGNALPSTEDPASVAESAAPTLESMEAASSLEDRVTPLVTSVAGAKLLFIACDEQPCTLRTQTTTLIGLHQVLTALSREFSGGISFEAREQLDAYTGRSFQADVMLDVTEGARAVPSDENELITAQ